ncbi:MAG: hypothetical protein ACI4JK_08575 [Oscillospiraceae bacterium]
MDNEPLDEVTENNDRAAEESEKETSFTIQEMEKKYITLDETITLQAIICVLISILFIAANMFAPEIAGQLSESFKENYYLSAEKTDNVLEAFLGFINSKPVSYD